jgi:hypothetical protein
MGQTKTINELERLNKELDKKREGHELIRDTYVNKLDHARKEESVS